MAEKSGFFSARETEYGTYDRVYDAEQFAEYFSNFISNGVYANPSNQLKVVYENGKEKPFVVLVRKGKAYIDGYWYELTEDMEITIPANTSPYVTKNTICCVLDKTERKISIVLKENVVDDAPVNNNVQHELVLCIISVQPNSSKLNVEDIVDKRADRKYCGFVTGLIDQIDTTELFKQYDDSFKIWFEEIKGQLTTDQAGNLQRQIGSLASLKTETKSDLVSAVNEEHNKTKVIDETVKQQGNFMESLKENLVFGDSNKVLKFGKMRIKFGSWTAVGTGKNYVKMIDVADLKRVLELEENFNQNKFACFVMNGEGVASPLNSVGTQWWVNDGLYCYFDGNLASGARYRINFIYLYFDDYTPINQ